MNTRVRTLLITLIVLAVSSGNIRDWPSNRERPQGHPVEEVHPTNRTLLQLLGEGRFEEVVKLGRGRIADRPPSCLPYVLTVQAAERTGVLRELNGELAAMVQVDPEDLFLLAGKGFAALELHEDTEALRYLEAALRRGCNCPRAYRSFVVLSQKLGRLREAEATLDELMTERPTDGLVLFARAFLWLRRGEGERARLGFQEAMLKAPPVAMTCRYYVHLLMAMAKYEQALALSRLGARVARPEADPDTMVDLLASQGVALERLEREGDSEGAFAKALLVAREYRLADLEAKVRFTQSLLMGSRGKMALSAQHLDSARSCEERLYLPGDKSQYQNRLGMVLGSLGEHEAAEAAYRKSIQLARFEDDPFLEVECRIRLGLLLLRRGEREKAQAELTEALRRANRFEDLGLQGRALSGLGATSERVGNYWRALDYYQRALESAKIAGDRQSEAMALANLGLVHFRLGSSAQALIYTARATQMADDLKNLQLEVGIRQGLAAALAGLGNFRESQRVYETASRIASRLSSPGLHALVLAGWARVTLELGNLEEAKEGFQRAFELAQSSGHTLVSLQALSGLGLAAWRQGELKEASRHFEEALQQIEAFRQDIRAEGDRMSYLETRSRIYASLAAVLIERDREEPGMSENAFDIIERSRSRALLDIVSRLSRSRDGALGTGLITQWDEVGGEPTTLRWLQSRVLRDGELLLEFSLGEPRSFMWIISRDEFRIVSLPSRMEIEKEVRPFLESVATPPRAPSNPFERQAALGRELFELLLGPVRQDVLSSRHLIIAPDGILYYLPFGALVVGQETETRYLVETISLSYIPSASILRELRRRGRSSTRPFDFLGIAQPGPVAAGAAGHGGDVEPPTMRPIPFAELEVRSVARLFPTDRCRTYIGREATESKVKGETLSHYRIIHFAAHALASSMFPERSAIFLARDRLSQEDGILEMREVVRLSLEADLIVLSGCQTGLGQILSAEGTLGLPWAFLSAGASSVLVSLWNVNDRSTSELMQVFYRRMREGDGRAPAMGRAQRELLLSERKAFRHPYYWAPFVLVGLAE